MPTERTRRMPTMTNLTAGIDTDTRFRELILYVAWRSMDDRDFGAVKLNKILFYADFNAYEKWAKPISGQEYQKLEFGPCPRRLLAVQNQLLDEGDADWQIAEVGNYTQRRLVPLREPNVEAFTAEEIALVDEVIKQLRGCNAKMVSEMSHDFIGWQLAELGETIPYTTLFLWDRKLTPAESVGGVTIEQNCPSSKSGSCGCTPVRAGEVTHRAGCASAR